jgi:hypothetical protein
MEKLWKQNLERVQKTALRQAPTAFMKVGTTSNWAKCEPSLLCRRVTELWEEHSGKFRAFMLFCFRSYGVHSAFACFCWSSSSIQGWKNHFQNDFVVNICYSSLTFLFRSFKTTTKKWGRQMPSPRPKYCTVGIDRGKWDLTVSTHLLGSGWAHQRWRVREGHSL